MDRGIQVCRPHLNSVIQFICRVSSKVVFLSKSHHFTDRLNSLAASSTLPTLYSQHTPIYIYLSAASGIHLTLPCAARFTAKDTFPHHAHTVNPLRSSLHKDDHSCEATHHPSGLQFHVPSETLSEHLHSSLLWPQTYPLFPSDSVLLEVASFSQVSILRI